MYVGHTMPAGLRIGLAELSLLRSRIPPSVCYERRRFLFRKAYEVLNKVYINLEVVYSILQDFFFIAELINPPDVRLPTKPSPLPLRVLPRGCLSAGYGFVVGHLPPENEQSLAVTN